MYFFRVISLAAFSVGSVNFKNKLAKQNHQRALRAWGSSGICDPWKQTGSVEPFSSHVDLATVSALGLTLLRRL